MTNPNNRDPAELWVVLDDQTMVPDYESSFVDREAAEAVAIDGMTHVTCYVPKAELERVKAELAAALERLAKVEQNCDTGSGHRFDSDGECMYCEMRKP